MIITIEFKKNIKSGGGLELSGENELTLELQSIRFSCHCED